MTLPLPGEYNPNFGKYIDIAVNECRVFEDLYLSNTGKVISAFGSLPDNKHDYAYASGKWTSKEMLMHLNDTERVFGYRALVCGRGDARTPLYYMEEDLYAANVSVTHRTMDELLQEFTVIRASNNFIFSNLTPGQSAFLGNNMDYKLSARAVAWAMIGHAIHHLNILNERYL